MTRLLLAAACAAALAAPAAAGGPPAGLWKFRFPQQDKAITFLFSFAEADGKWVGDYVGSTARLRAEPKFAGLDVDGDHVRFALTFGGQEFVNFDGVLAKDGAKITGSYSQFGGPLKLTEMYPSKLKKLTDPFELARENLGQIEAGPELFEAGFEVVKQAGAKKVPADEARALADRLGKVATAYGPRWERAVAVRLAGTLAGQEGLAEVALAQARRAERLLTDDAPAAVQMEVADTLATVLAKAGKADEAKKYQAQVAKLDAREYADYAKKSLTFVGPAFGGRKAKNDRAVLVEVFTGSECPPCAAADLAADGLMKAYPPADVVVLQYHAHIPAPDPLTSPDGVERADYYGEAVRGTPAVFFNGKPGAEGGGPAAAAKGKYAEFREVVDPLLEKPAPLKLTVTVTKAEKGYAAKAAVADAPAGGKAVLRFALAEERVRYAGGNGIRYHHHVVRAMPGGAKGFPLTKPAQDETVTFDPAEVREKLAKYLDEYVKAEGEFARPDRPLALANLLLVAFVQNDATGEVLQVVQVPVEGK